MLPADTKSVATALCSSGGACIQLRVRPLHLLPGFQKAQMNNPMVDVDLKANTTKSRELPWLGQCTGNGFPETLPVQGHVPWTMPRTAHGHTPRLSRYDASVEGDIATLGNGKTGVSQAKETEMKVQSDYLLTTPTPGETTA